MTSGPPLASSWAVPPEFYTDENAGTRAVRRRLTQLGYVVHSPAELYGSREQALGARDEDWLARVGQRGWAVIGRDVKIYERPAELAAYLAAGVHVFLLPGEAKVVELVQLIELNLADMCAYASGRKPATWRLTMTGPMPFDVTGAIRGARRRRSAEPAVHSVRLATWLCKQPSGSHRPSLSRNPKSISIRDQPKTRPRSGYPTISCEGWRRRSAAGLGVRVRFVGDRRVACWRAGQAAGAWL